MKFRDLNAGDVARDLMATLDTYGVAVGDDQVYSRLFIQTDGATAPSTFDVDYLSQQDMPRDEDGQPEGATISFFSSSDLSGLVHSDDSGNHYIRLDQYNTTGWESLMKAAEEVAGSADADQLAAVALQITLYTGVDAGYNSHSSGY